MEQIVEEPRCLSLARLLLDRNELAIILKRSPVTIRNQIYRTPEKLPPSVEGSAPRVWYLPAVEAWLLDRSSGAEAAPSTELIQSSKVKRGRPRKQSSQLDAA